MRTLIWRTEGTMDCMKKIMRNRYLKPMGAGQEKIDEAWKARYYELMELAGYDREIMDNLSKSGKRQEENDLKAARVLLMRLSFMEHEASPTYMMETMGIEPGAMRAMYYRNYSRNKTFCKELKRITALMERDNNKLKTGGDDNVD